MKRNAVFIFVACCVVSALSLAEDEKRSKPSATLSPAEEFNVSSATTPKPTTTTPKPTTTTPKPTTTTPKPTTTTPKPTTTTPKPTTTTPKPTTPKPTTTTPKPTTTTPKPTTTTPKPTTPPPPEPTPSTNLTVGNYTITKEGNVICLKAQMALQIKLATPKSNGTFIVQPMLTKVGGSCDATTANLTLTFKEGSISFMFNKDTAKNTVYVNTLSFDLFYSFSKGAKENYTANNKSVHLFAARVGHCYSCKSESLYMGNGLYLDVIKDRMQAFNLTKNDFGFSDYCPADQPDYRVAIGVGVTLLVLIVIVVVAYLLSRRRRTGGYQTL
ncbi:macrosialin [Xiphias gladius]|uniref:macrosialin n=1 Tax=Xiphias gladius TaxID=8245 RepID=UPI001A99B696|nr:macrosialin [Xiphias gladius]